PDVIERFWSRVNKTNTCWEWTAPNSVNKYGSFSVEGVLHKAHRVAFAIANGSVPSGVCVCHRCDNPACVRPDHLFLGTHMENILDRDRKGRVSRVSR